MFGVPRFIDRNLTITDSEMLADQIMKAAYKLRNTRFRVYYEDGAQFFFLRGKFYNFNILTSE